MNSLMIIFFSNQLPSWLVFINQSQDKLQDIQKSVFFSASQVLKNCINSFLLYENILNVVRIIAEIY